MDTVTTNKGLPQWDFILNTDANSLNFGGVETVELDAEQKQRAIIATYLQKGTIMQMPDIGAPIVELLTGSMTPSAFNAALQENIHKLANTLAYKVDYSILDDKLVLNVTEA